MKLAKVTAEMLYHSYRGVHDSVYDQQTITVTGYVTFMGPDGYGLACVELGDRANDQPWVACVLEQAPFTVHQLVTITGHVEGFTQRVVVLKDCAVNEDLKRDDR